MELRRSDARLGSSRAGKSFIAWLLVLTLIFPVVAGKAAQAAYSSSWTKMGGASLSTPSYVNTLLQVDGTLYAGASDGLWTYSDSDDAWTQMNGLTGDVNTLLQIEDTLYALVPDGVWIYSGGEWMQMSDSPSYVNSLHQVDDTLYALVPDGVWTYSGGEWAQMSDSPSAVYDMLHVNGTLYVGTADGIWTYRNGAWTQTSGMPSDVGVSNMMLYNFAGTLYALVQESGDTDWSSSIWAYSAISDVDGTWIKMEGEDAPSHANALLHIDGSLYARAADGIWTYSDGEWTHVDGSPSGLGPILSVDGTLNAGASDGVWTYRDGEWMLMEGSPSEAYALLNEDSTLYAVTEDGVYRYKSGSGNTAPDVVTAISGESIEVTTEPVSITVPQGVTDVTVQLTTTTNGPNEQVATLPLIEVNAATALGNVSVSIPAGTTITGPAGWDGTMGLPQVLSNSSVAVNNGTVNAVIEVGAGNSQLTFNKAVRLVLPGQAGKSAGFARNGVVRDITRTLGADDQATADVEIPAEGDAKIAVGSDLVIWTKHFTAFLSYTASTTNDLMEWQVVGDGIFPSKSSKPVVAFDSSGAPYVVYEDADNGDKLTVKKYEGSHWDTVGNAGFSTLVSGDLVSLVFDGNDIPYVLYRDKERNTGATVMKYDQDEQGQYQWMTVGSPNISYNTTYDYLKYLSIAIDRNGTPYVAYSSMNNDDNFWNVTSPGEHGARVIVKKYVDNKWVRVGSKSVGGRDAAFLYLTFDTSGSTDIPYVLYQDTKDSNAKGTVKKYDESSNSWVAVGNSTSTGYLWFASIAINSSGIPYVAFGDGGDSEKAFVKTLVGSSWETVGGAEVSEGATDYPMIVLDSSETPYVVYQDMGTYDSATGQYSGATYKSTVKKFVGSSWETVGGEEISSSEAYAASIALDGNDTLYIAYWDTSESVVVKKLAPIPKYTVSASAATDTPEVGADDAITLTVKDALGNTDTSFSGAHDVTVSGYLQAPDNSYGSFNGTELTGANTTVSVTFTNGVATANLKLNKAAAQTILFSVADVATPATNTVSLTVTEAAVLSSENDITVFSLEEQTDHATISASAHTVDIEVASGTNLNGLVATFALSAGASAQVGTVDQVSGTTANDFTASVVYTVKAEDGSTQNWTVNVSIAAAAAAQTVTALAATGTSVVGVDDAITLTVKDALGNTDTSFGGAHDVTVSGYLQASDNSYGSFNGTALTAGPNTVSVTFVNGVATANLRLNKAAAQTILFSVADVATPATNTVSLTPIAGVAASMALTTNIAAPASNGGVFAQQPGVTLLDAYGNTSTGDNSTVVTVSRKDTGAWMLTGTLTATASGGVATFTDLGATNEAEVAGAQLAFDAAGGLTQIVSQSVTLPWSGTVPSAPTGVTAKAGNGQAVVSFTAPANGGSGITSYEVKAVHTNITATGPGSPITITGLTNGVTYTFTVKAINSAGSSTASDASNPVTPSAPSNSGGTWTPPAAPTTTLDPEPPTDAEPTTDPEQPAVAIFNSGIINEANLLKMFESKVAEAKKANVKIEYADIQGHWAEKAIDIFAKLHLISGYENGTFKPDGHITRAEFAVILSHVFEITGGDNAKAELKDVGSHWAKEAIAKLIKAGVINGYKDGTFRPGNTITREEMVVMLSRIVNLDNVTKDTSKGRFNDLNGTYAAEEIKAVAQAGIISGKGGGKFDPHNKATRAEALQIILNVLKLNPQLKARLDSLNE